MKNIEEKIKNLINTIKNIRASSYFIAYFVVSFVVVIICVYDVAYNGYNRTNSTLIKFHGFSGVISLIIGATLRDDEYV